VKREISVGTFRSLSLQCHHSGDLFRRCLVIKHGPPKQYPNRAIGKTDNHPPQFW